MAAPYAWNSLLPPKHKSLSSKQYSIRRRGLPIPWSMSRSVFLSPSSVIPSTFSGLHTVYAPCRLPEPCFFTVLTSAAKRKIGSDNPLWLPKPLPANEHSLLPGVKLIPVIPESNGSSKGFCASQRAKTAIRLGFSGSLGLRHRRADAIRPPLLNQLKPQMNPDQSEGPNLPPTLDLLLPDTVQFRHNNRPLNFPLQLGADCKCES